MDGSLVVSWNWRSPPSSITELLELDSCLNDLSLVSIGTSYDKWSWRGCSSGVFSVSSLRGAWESKVYPPLEYKHFWNNLVSIKINFFAWRAVLNRLPVKTDLIKRGVVLNSGTCDLCGAGVEYVIHLPWECCWVRDVWSMVQYWCELDLSDINSVEHLLSASHSFAKSPSQIKMTHAIIFSALWSLWKARNDCSFNNITPSQAHIFEDIKANSFHVDKKQERGTSLNWSSWCIFPLM
ncbi:unnamed protein product [Lactuca virosa]|uniref:Reverse transcriptase zinc-binding domain-containing protein n=1 Tax=Lactuca virosa TaxID=75947 RepID=A0AAU9PLD8_9ASTR|nr:unnamed protein product [Lactuca virosa]